MGQWHVVVLVKSPETTLTLEVSPFPLSLTAQRVAAIKFLFECNLTFKITATETNKPKSPLCSGLYLLCSSCALLPILRTWRDAPKRLRRTPARCRHIAPIIYGWCSVHFKLRWNTRSFFTCRVLMKNLTNVPSWIQILCLESCLYIKSKSFWRNWSWEYHISHKEY